MRGVGLIPPGMGKVHSFLTFFKNRKTGKRKHDFIFKNNNDTFKCGIHLTVRVCTTKRLFAEHVFIKISYCVLKIIILKMKKNIEFFNLGGLSFESFLAIWPPQYKFLINEFVMKKVCTRN